MTSILVRGALAGATGTALLTATTYLDMALTGRPASRAPERTVAELLRRANLPVPDDRQLTALGALSGIATGIIPSRLHAAPLMGRVAAGAVGGLALARRERSSVVLPAMVGAGGAVMGSVLGAAWREVAARHGWSCQAGLAEDAASLTAAWIALR